MGITGLATRTIPKYLDPLPGGTQLVDSIEFVVGWARANSLWPLVYGTACCAMEMMSAGSSRHDWARFGVEVARATPRQADLIVLAGTIVEKMGSRLVTLYEQMPGSKYVIAMGSCAISGGPFYYDSYSVIKGGDRLIPVDVYIPGCPPRPEALLQGIMELQKKIRTEGRRNPWVIGGVNENPSIDIFSTAKKNWAEAGQKQFVADDEKYILPSRTKPSRKAVDDRPEVTAREKKLSGMSAGEIDKVVAAEFRGIKNVSREEPGQGRTIDYRVSSRNYIHFITFLKNHSELRLDYLLQIMAIDHGDRFEVSVQLMSSSLGHRVFVQCDLEHANPQIETISSIFLGAEWHEREIFDLFGITFLNHPDMRRFFLEDDFPGHPMRKDFSDPTRVIPRPY
ncbi:MAG: NADH-quinone oxidoreductase subunit NuoB [Desulfobulbaceae bacterium]|nr:NADH-quinone oxidoreductase subunit NuoB [Desulfobulbaceae bacterium]